MYDRHLAIPNNDIYRPIIIHHSGSRCKSITLIQTCAITSICYGNKIFILTKRCFLDVYTILHQYICIVMQTQNVVHFPKWQVTWTLIVFPSPKILNASNQLKYDKPWFPFWNSIGAKIKNAFCHQYWFLFWNMTSQKFF